MEFKDQKIAFKYMYNAGLSLCLLHAAFLGITFNAYAGQVGGLTDLINTVWWALFLGWPIWLVALVVFWFNSDRKLWRLLVPIGLGAVFFTSIAWFIGTWIWALETGHWRM